MTERESLDARDQELLREVWVAIFASPQLSTAHLLAYDRLVKAAGLVPGIVNRRATYE